MVVGGVKSLQLCQTLCNPRLLCPWDSLGKNTEAGCHFLLQGNLPNPGIESASPAAPELAGGFFTTEPPGKPCSLLKEIILYI